MKRTALIIVLILIINCIVIFASVKSGLNKGDMMLRFHERQAITFLSALMLGLISLINLVMYLLKKKVTPSDSGRWFWFFSCLGFFYLCMDEYFMAHEGMDEAVGSLFGKDIKHLNLDNMVIAAFGLLALAVCLRFRSELIKHKEIFPFLVFGAVGLIGTVIFHSFERQHIIMEVVEESFKILGVSFFFAGFLATLVSFIKRLSISNQ